MTKCIPQLNKCILFLLITFYLQTYKKITFKITVHYSHYSPPTERNSCKTKPKS